MGVVAASLPLTLSLPRHFLDIRAQRDGFILLGAFLVSFLFIRTSARLMRSPKVPWWPGSIKTDSGLHIHHLVFGIVLILLCGFLGFATTASSPWSELLSAGFGVGAGLTLDEFALWVRLEDVYWAREGRASLDAVVLATLVGGMVVLGLAPFDTSDASSEVSFLLIVGADVLLCVLAILKGKSVMALVGVFIPFVSLIGAIRIASPSSPWARWWYPPDSRKLARSNARFARSRSRRYRLMDAIGGAPELPAGASTTGDARDENA